MKTKTYAYLVLVGIILLLAVSVYEITKLKNEISELEKSKVKLMDEKECHDLFYDNEGLVILMADEVNTYCSDLLGS